MDSSIQSIGASLRPYPEPSKELGGPPSHQNVISKFGESLTEEQRTSILAKFLSYKSLEHPSKRLRGIVDSFLEENGITPPGQRGPCGGPLSNESAVSQLTEGPINIHS